MKKSFTICLCIFTLGIFSASAQKKQELIDKISSLEKQLKKAEFDISIAKEKEILLNQKVERANAEIMEAREETTKLLSTMNNFSSVSEQRVQNLTISLETIKQKDAQLKIVNDELAKAKEEKITQLNIFKDGLGAVGKVGFQNGILTVVIPNADLYEEGKSIMLSENGVAIIAKVNTLLTKYPKYHIIVEGNSNELEFSKDKLPKDNWDLSALQASAIARQLTASENGLAPKRIEISAKSKFNTDAVETVTRILVKPSYAQFFNTVMEGMKE